MNRKSILLPVTLALGLGFTSWFWAATMSPGQAVLAAPTLSVNSTGDAHAGGDLTNGICQTAADNTTCTLRAAIEKANNWPGGGVTIDFAGVTVPATYTLSLGALAISNTMSIVGAGPSGTVIDGNGSATNDRVFTIITDEVNISGVTVTNGRRTSTPSDPDAFGGGIFNTGSLTLTNVIVSHNSLTTTMSIGESHGGGIYSPGNITLINSSVISNAANSVSGGAAGGGIEGTVVTLVNSTVSGNTADFGGGIFSGGTVINSTVSGNTAFFDGGGIVSIQALTLIGSTVSGNTAANGGGVSGVRPLMLLNSTVSGNQARDNGGGIYLNVGTASLFNVTIADNQANAKASGVGLGGGINNASGTVNFQNSIIANNTNVLIINGFRVLNREDCSGTLTSQGFNLISETTDCTINGPFTQADPLLGPLQDNGGPTLTHALVPGSPAIDMGQPGNCTDNLGTPITTDQRGRPRPAFGETSFRCDIGAYELQQMIYLPLVAKQATGP